MTIQSTHQPLTWSLAILSSLPGSYRPTIFSRMVNLITIFGEVFCLQRKPPALKTICGCGLSLICQTLHPHPIYFFCCGHASSGIFTAGGHSALADSVEAPVARPQTSDYPPGLPITNMPGPGARLPGHCSKLVGIKNAGPSPRNDPLTQAVVMVMIK